MFKETDGLVIPGLPSGPCRRPSIRLTAASSPYQQNALGADYPLFQSLLLLTIKLKARRSLTEVLLELQGNRTTNGEDSKCDFTTLYVQLSRCTTLQGIKLLSPIRQQDFIGNRLDQTIVDGMQRLRVLAPRCRNQTAI